METSLVVKQSVRIDAPVTRVWEVLTKPHYIRQWSQLPEDFGDYDIHPATIINFAGQGRMDVVEYKINKNLRYQLYVPEWQEQGVSHIGYDYTLNADIDGYTWLGIEIGDFALLTENDKLFDDSAHFGKTASQKIKELAEKKEILL
ncbi:hypothetical protein [Flavobacterium psychrotrophum]|uniref:hypothetical protein n=1 Tax=Flavobacterium psychrotrophum TaxID=2294119 RepID=UPI001969655B|nr:hypothetical protein [Flavobacterium psychrotrophum]